MSLSIGTMLGPYEIVAPLGAGGMGEVYRAKDGRLDREVAIKVLPELVAHDKERVLRFEREAKLLATLSHPNIAAIHGFEQFDGQRFLVLEYVEGETLAQRLRRGPPPIDDALELCKHVAEALEAAHEKGIVHRDLKPANVMVKPDGSVKVLDFGLARAMQDDSGSTTVRIDSPTITADYTKPGVVLGTAPYMSPEQARGRPVDKRSDIWSFGVILYECLTGETLFHGETATDSLGAIMHREPDWALLPANTPPTIQLLLRRCLTKDRNKRLHDIGDARVELDEAIADPTSSSLRLASAAMAATSTRRSIWRIWAPWTLAAAGVIAAGASLWRAWKPIEHAPQRPIRLRVEVSPKEPILSQTGAQFAMSPDGSRLVFVAGAERNRKLYLRPLDQQESTLLAGTEGALHPFFSPDGQWVGFFTDKKLMKVSISGGAPLSICDVDEDRGGTWSPDDSIIFSRCTQCGLSRVSAMGGVPEALTTPNSQKDERSHRWPTMLPGGKAVLFTSQMRNTDFNAANIEALSLESRQRKVIHRGGAYARYVPSGHLVFIREGTMFTAPFDLMKLELTRAPTPVLDHVTYNPMNGGSHYTFSESGTLVYAAGSLTIPTTSLVWVDRSGAVTPLLSGERLYQSPRFSPDGSRLAIEIMTTGGTSDIWVCEIARGTMTRLTFGPDVAGFPVWSPDGQYIAFSFGKTGNLFRLRADGTGQPERLTQSNNDQWPSTWSPDGKVIVFAENSDKTRDDLWLLHLEGERKAEPYLQTPFDDVFAVYSPDGKWLAYSSNETGLSEVYVRSLSGPGGKWQVSSAGGETPKWSADGKELFYRNENKMMAVAVTAEGATLRAATPILLFERTFGGIEWNPEFDVAPDGKRFVILKPTNENNDDSITHLTFVLNWYDDLREKVPTGKLK